MNLQENIRRIKEEFKRKRPTIYENIDQSSAVIEFVYFHKSDSDIPVAASFILTDDEILAHVSPSSGRSTIIYHGRNAAHAAVECIAYIHQFFKQAAKTQKLMG